MLWIVLMTMRDFVAQHLVWLLIPAVILFAVLMPGAAVAVFRFLTRTLAGQIIVACLASGLVVWFVRGFIDDAADRTREIVAARAESARADAARRAADARLAELRRQVEAAAALTREANDRAATNEAAVLAYQQRESDYEAALDKADAETPARVPACALDDADLRGLRRAASAYRPVDAPGAARAARKLWPARRRP